MNKTTILINLLISSISVVKPIHETTKNRNIDEVSEKYIEVQNFHEEDPWNDINKDDILRTSEINESANLRKDSFVNIRYLKETESNGDEAIKVSSEDNNPTTSKSITININTLEDKSTEKFDSETKAGNEGENNKNYSSEIDKKASNVDNTTEIVDKKGGTVVNIENPVDSQDKVDEFESRNSKNESDDISENTDYEFRKPNDESNSDWDVLDDLVTTRRMNVRLNYSVLDENATPEVKIVTKFEENNITRSEENIVTKPEEKDVARSEENDVTSRAEKIVEPVEVPRSIPIPEYITPVKSNINGKNRINYPANIQLPHVHPGQTLRENPHNPAVFNIQHTNPIDLNAISNYEKNILRHNRIIPITRRNDIRQMHGVESSAELRDSKVIDDFNSVKRSNAYPFTPLVSIKKSHESISSNHYDSLMSKLIQASENLRNVENPSGENTNLYRGHFNNFKPNITLPSKFGLYKFVNI